MDISFSTNEHDYLSTVSLLEEAKPRGIVGHLGRWIEELEEEFRSERSGYEPLFDFPRDM